MTNLIVFSYFKNVWEIFMPSGFYLKGENLDDLRFFLNVEIEKNNLNRDNLECCYITDKGNYYNNYGQKKDILKKVYSYSLKCVKNINNEKVMEIWKVNKEIYSQLYFFVQANISKRIKLKPLSYNLDSNHYINCIKIYAIGCSLILMIYKDNILELERHYKINYELIIGHENADYNEYFNSIIFKVNTFVRENNSIDINGGYFYLIDEKLKPYKEYIISKFDLEILNYNEK